VTAAPPDAAIRIRGVCKTYRTKRGADIVALQDLTLDIYRGEFVSVVGPSGCGKTTLLNMIAGLLGPSSGTISLQNSPVSGPRRDVGIVFQSPVLLPWRTVFQNAMLPVRVQRLDQSVYARRARDLLEMVGLADFGDRYPWELSGGMRQRAAIVRALVHDPAILLMDEPFGALDAMTREQLDMELLRIWRESGKTIVFVTHSLSEAIFLADRCLVLCSRPGRLVDLVEVCLPRPRSLSLENTPEFGIYVQRIRRALGGAEDPGEISANLRALP
jgi:NitT/TauT family transport system ATP-binding protein